MRHQYFSVFYDSEWFSAFCEKQNFVFLCFSSLRHAVYFYSLPFLKCLKPQKLIVLKMKFEIRAECIQLRQHGPYLRQCVLLAVAELHDVATVGDVCWEINDVVDGWRGAWK